MGPEGDASDTSVAAQGDQSLPSDYWTQVRALVSRSTNTGLASVAAPWDIPW